jgi:hypothetical protein
MRFSFAFSGDFERYQDVSTVENFVPRAASYFSELA